MYVYYLKKMKCVKRQGLAGAENWGHITVYANMSHNGASTTGFISLWLIFSMQTGCDHS